MTYIWKWRHRMTSMRATHGRHHDIGDDSCCSFPRRRRVFIAIGRPPTTIADDRGIVAAKTRHAKCAGPRVVSPNCVTVYALSLLGRFCQDGRKSTVECRSRRNLPTRHNEYLHNHAVCALAHVRQIRVARSDLEHLSAHYLAIRIHVHGAVFRRHFGNYFARLRSGTNAQQIHHSLQRAAESDWATRNNASLTHHQLTPCRLVGAACGEDAKWRKGGWIKKRGARDAPTVRKYKRRLSPCAEAEVHSS